MRTVVSYAQNREDIILSGFFDENEKGFYVDIGAADAKHDSVTKLFYDKGWKGINIDPLRQHYEVLRRERPRDINLCIGVGNVEGSKTLREYTLGTGLSTVSEGLKKQYGKSGAAPVSLYTDHKIEVKTLAAIFSEQNVETINFMKIDVEGYEYEVLEGNDWREYRPEVLCIEANHIDKDWRSLLKKNKYSLVFFDGLNEYYVANEKKSRAERFSYVDTVVQAGVIVPYQVAEQLDKYERLKHELEEYATEIASKNQYISNLEATVSQITPLRRHVRRQIKLHIISVDTKIMGLLAGNKRYDPQNISRSTGGDLAQIAMSDQLNFHRFNTSRKRSFPLRAYLAARRAGISLALKLMGVRKV